LQKKNKLKKPARIALRVLYIFVAAVAAVVGGFFLGAHYQNTKHEIEQLAAQKAYYQDIMHSENAYLATLQLPEGPIAQREIDEDGAVMNPYFACFTVLALLEEPELYAENARRYLLWHMANLNTGDEDVFGVHGSINDHKIYRATRRCPSSKRTATTASIRMRRCF